MPRPRPRRQYLCPAAAAGTSGSPGDDLGRWEHQSDPLTVPGTYRKRFAMFADHFERELNAPGDEDLERGLDLLRELAATGDDAGTAELLRRSI